MIHSRFNVLLIQENERCSSYWVRPTFRKSDACAHPVLQYLGQVQDRRASSQFGLKKGKVCLARWKSARGWNTTSVQFNWLHSSFFFNSTGTCNTNKHTKCTNSSISFVWDIWTKKCVQKSLEPLSFQIKCYLSITSCKQKNKHATCTIWLINIYVFSISNGNKKVIL